MCLIDETLKNNSLEEQWSYIELSYEQIKKQCEELNYTYNDTDYYQRDMNQINNRDKNTHDNDDDNDYDEEEDEDDKDDKNMNENRKEQQSDIYNKCIIF